MGVHANAKLGPAGRIALVELIGADVQGRRGGRGRRAGDRAPVVAAIFRCFVGHSDCGGLGARSLQPTALRAAAHAA
jgi:hypothetical protein